MVELHFRDENTGAIYRAIYGSPEEALNQARADLESGSSSRLPFVVVAHDPDAVFSPNGDDGESPAGTYNLADLTQVAVVAHEWKTPAGETLSFDGQAVLDQVC